jgi:hypothetical protein
VVEVGARVRGRREGRISSRTGRIKRKSRKRIRITSRSKRRMS